MFLASDISMLIDTY